MTASTPFNTAGAIGEAPTEPTKVAHGAGPNLLSIDSAILNDVRVALKANLGETLLSIEELLALKSGSVVKLDLKMNELIELRLNGSLIARGEMVAVDDNFGIRIVEILDRP